MPRKQSFKPSRKPKPAVEQGAEPQAAEEARSGSREREVEHAEPQRSAAEPSDVREHDVERGAVERTERTAIDEELEPFAPSNRGWEVHPDDVEC